MIANANIMGLGRASQLIIAIRIKYGKELSALMN